MSRPTKVKANGASAPIGRDVWLGSQREKEIGWLQARMAEPVDGKTRFRLAAEARKVRRGSSDLLGRPDFVGRALIGVSLPMVF